MKILNPSLEQYRKIKGEFYTATYNGIYIEFYEKDTIDSLAPISWQITL